MDQLVEQLLHSPKMEIYLDQINRVRREEQLARERFLDEITEDDKSEFINGEKFVHSPTRASHNNGRANLMNLMRNFAREKKRGIVGDEKWMISLTRNDYEPDISFWRTETSAKFEPDQMRFPAPDLIVEFLSPSTEANDRGVKFEDYAAHGVAEYWIVDASKQIVEQYKLVDGNYQLLLKSGSGAVRSEVIAGFAIPIIAIFDDAENAAALRKLLA